MKQHLPLILFVLVVISSIARMAKSTFDVLIGIAIVAVVGLLIWLYESGKIRIDDRVKNILKKIGIGFVYTISILYIIAMVVYAIYSLCKSGSWYGVILLLMASIIAAVSWYLARYHRWWVKFLKAFVPNDIIHHSYWKLREKYYWTFDYATNAKYALINKEGIFLGQARVWLDKRRVDVSAKLKLSIFEKQLKKRDIEAKCALIHIPGCIYADICAETNYKTMNHSRIQAFRDTFLELAEINYTNEYYAKYHGELGTFLFAACQDNITRAIRIEPTEEYFIGPEYGFRSDEAYYFIEHYPHWSEGTYTLITEKEFFDRWRERTDYENDDEAFDLFNNLSIMYFAAVANGDKKEQANCRWDIENIAKWLIANNEIETMKSLMCSDGQDAYEETMYWATRIFKEVLPEEAKDTALRLVNNCDNPQIVSRAKKLLTQWKEGCKK